MNFFSKIVLAFAASLMLSLLGARAANVWTDNFDANAGSRWTSNSVWQIGSPTVGPSLNAGGFRSHSGSSCATTGLKSGAADNADRRLICTNYNGSTNLMIPSAGQHPRLRFYQWFSFRNSEGYVELQVSGTTNWQTISPTNISVGPTVHDSGGVWSRPSLDLSAYAGQKVQFAFHFTSGPGLGSDLGWYVDDVAVVVSDFTFNDPEDFEGGLGDWAVDFGTWQVGVPTSGPPTNSTGFRAHSGTNCAATVLAGNFGLNADSRLISPPFTVPASGNPEVRFWEWYNFVNARGFVEVNSSIVLTNTMSITNIVTSTNTIVITNFTIITDSNSIPPVTTTNVTGFTTNTTIQNISTNVVTSINVTTNAWQTISQTNTSPGGTPLTSNGQWTNTVLDLSPFAGQTLQLAFHFQSGPGGWSPAPGWYVDDITFAVPPDLTVPTDKLITKGQLFTATATATNSASPDSQFTFRFASPSTNAFITSDGTINWTNTKPKIGTNLLSITVTDDSVPPGSVTKDFKVIVWPAFTFSAADMLSSKHYLLLTLTTDTNRTWRVDASTNLLNWKPLFTNLVPPGGMLQFTDRLATNFPTRFYRAIYP